jgi:hypothetical protein
MMLHPDRRNPHHPDLNLSNSLILSTMAEEYRGGGYGLLQAANLVFQLSTESIGPARHGAASPKARAAKDGDAQRRLWGLWSGRCAPKVDSISNMRAV